MKIIWLGEAITLEFVKNNYETQSFNEAQSKCSLELIDLFDTANAELALLNLQNYLGENQDKKATLIIPRFNTLLGLYFEQGTFNEAKVFSAFKGIQKWFDFFQLNRQRLNLVEDRFVFESANFNSLQNEIEFPQIDLSTLVKPNPSVLSNMMASYWLSSHRHILKFDEKLQLSSMYFSDQSPKSYVEELQGAVKNISELKQSFKSLEKDKEQEIANCKAIISNQNEKIASLEAINKQNNIEFVQAQSENDKKSDELNSELQLQKIQMNELQEELETQVIKNKEFAKLKEDNNQQKQVTADLKIEYEYATKELKNELSLLGLQAKELQEELEVQISRNQNLSDNSAMQQKKIEKLSKDNETLLFDLENCNKLIEQRKNYLDPEDNYLLDKQEKDQETITTYVNQLKRLKEQNNELSEELNRCKNNLYNLQRQNSELQAKEVKLNALNSELKNDIEMTKESFELTEKSLNETTKLLSQVKLITKKTIKAKYKDSWKYRRQIKGQAKQLLESKLFDTSWYLENYPFVMDEKIDPCTHYLLFGWIEGLNPSEEFDSYGYLSVNIDVAEKGINPLLHYMTWGLTEGRSPSPLQKKLPPPKP